jgi:fumarate hydratase class I
MLKLRDGIIELYKKAATSIPNDVERALKKAYEEETESLSRESLRIILENIYISRSQGRPLCQDTGFPVFFIKIPRGLSHKTIKEVVIDATKIATKKIPLRPNAVDVISEKNTGDNVGELFPLIYMEETEEQSLEIDLILKGGGCENLSQTYKLPTTFFYNGKEIIAERDFDGVKKCILDAVLNAQGKGCPPYTISAAIGGAKDQITYLAKKQLLRRIDDSHPIDVISELERKVLNDINELGIGTGLGGKTTAIGVKIGTAHRHPASYFVEVSFCCWANRRARLIW